MMLITSYLMEEKMTSGGTTNYLMDGLSVLAEYSNSSAVSASYIPGISVTTGGNTYYYHHDRLGSTRFLSDSSGNIVREYSCDTCDTHFLPAHALHHIPVQFFRPGFDPYFLAYLSARWYLFPIPYRGGPPFGKNCPFYSTGDFLFFTGSSGLYRNR